MSLYARIIGSVYRSLLTRVLGNCNILLMDILTKISQVQYCAQILHNTLSRDRPNPGNPVH